jgi:hypothetical protein
MALTPANNKPREDLREAASRMTERQFKTGCMMANPLLQTTSVANR